MKNKNTTFLLFLVLFASCSGQQEIQSPEAVVSPKPEQPPIDISAPSLYSEYAQNGIATTQRYSGKKLCVSGQAYMISTTNSGDIFVAISAGAGGYAFVQCYFNNASQLQSIKRGDPIKITGTFISGKGTVVYLDGCSITL